MPRSGDTFSLPAGTAAVSGASANSADVNSRFADLEAEQNLVRPIAHGGTGASSAPAALIALGLTATAAELNILDGVTATTAELNILDGVTANAAELNILDGATLTVTELNYVDGVTSSIQAQLDAKVAVIADPGSDRIRFWDDSAGAEAYLEVGTGLAIAGTTITTSLTTSEVLAATAGASAGAVGTYAMLIYSAGSSSLATGSTVAGSNLEYSSVSSGGTLSSGNPAGTWRLMGYGNRSSVWLRIA